MQSTVVTVLLAASVVVLAGPGVASACSCLERDPLKPLSEGVATFTGNVTEVRLPGSVDGQFAEIDIPVDRVIHGDVGSEVTVFDELNTSCSGDPMSTHRWERRRTSHRCRWPSSTSSGPT